MNALLRIIPKARRNIPDAECAAIYREAHAQGKHAASARPIEYQEFLLPDGRKIFRAKPEVHGQAYIAVPIGSFRNWAKRERLTGTINGDKIWVTQYNSDLLTKIEYAKAFSRVLNDRGIASTVHALGD